MAVHESELTDLSRQGLALYGAKLKALLEPQYNEQFVAIHVDTEDYAVGRTSSAATQALLKRHPIDGRLVVRKVGPEPEYGLAARLLMGEMMAAHQK